MLAIITYEEEVLIEFDPSIDGFILSEDEGRSYPYELYEDIILNGEDSYLIYLDDKNQVPTSTHDKWLDLESALKELKSFQSKTREGQRETDKLILVLTEFSELNIM